MSKDSTRGVTKNQDLDPGLITRDTRSWRQKLNSFSSTEGVGFVMIGSGSLITILPILGVNLFFEPFILLSIFYFFYSKNKKIKLQYREPMSIDQKGKVHGKGLFFLGNDLGDNSEIWFSNDDLRTHMLVFGSTGSGKTRFLLGLLYQALLCGSGCLYTDGKGDNSVWWLVFSFCRRVERLDDLLVMNYLTGDGSSAGDDNNSLDRLSNTNNPFAYGSSEQLRSLIVGLMRSGGGDDSWKGMASAMMGGLLKCLTYMRDIGEINLDVSAIREYLPLDQIVRLSQRPDLKDSALSPIQKYLAELPGYVEEEAVLGRINPKVYEQHGYRIMQFSEVLSDLEDTYGHIFSAQRGEIDLKDVVFNRRILFVMLPALEKDPDALSGLGKMVVAGVRAALGPALGNKLEGLKSEVIDQKPTNSNVPFFLILDEYGYYSVKGFAVVAAQARSLGVCVVFAGQDYPSFKRGSPEEAQATIANTNIKLGMKVEEDETAKIIIDRAADSEVSVTDGSEKTTSEFCKYKDNGRVRIEKRKRINYRDMVQQKPGQAHVIFGDELSRCQLFYAEPVEVFEAYLNKFVMVNNPTKAKLSAINGSLSKVDELFNGNSKIDNSVIMDSGLKTLISDFKSAIAKKEDFLSASVIAAGLVEWRLQNKDNILKEKAELIEKKKANKTTNESNKISAKAVKIDNENESWNKIKELSNTTSGEQDKEGVEDNEILENMINAPLDSIKQEALNQSKQFEELLNDALLQNIMNNSKSPISAKERKDMQVRNILNGYNDFDSDNEDNDADLSLDFLSDINSYPEQPVPSKKDIHSLQEHLLKLLEQVGNS